MKVRPIGLCIAVGVVCLALAGVCRAQQHDPEANPARPTVTNPATLPPVGYLQFEQGYQGALNSPETDSQYGVVQTTKLAVQDRLMVQITSQPFARSVVDGQASRAAGDVLAGGEAVLFTPKESEDDVVKEARDKHRHSYVRAAVPTVTLGYLGRVHAGSAPDLDVGSFRQGLTLLASGHAPFIDVHYDTNFVVNEQIGDTGERRAQFGETFSVDRPIYFNAKLQFSGEVYHFSQPLVHTTSSGKFVSRANLVAVLFAASYELKPYLVFDGGFSHGLTSTSTQWQSFAGFTYLLPKRLW